jgi:hypothetical protein
MKDSLNHNIFSETDCLSEQTLFDYIDKKLSAKESHVVERHLLSCELCSDAIEGLETLKDRSRISTIKSEINKRVSVPQRETKVISINYKIVLSIAASILLLIGGVFFFNLLNNKSEMAAIKQDEAVLPPPPPATASEESEVNSKEVLEEAPKESITEAAEQTSLENKKTYDRNSSLENEPLASQQATTNNSVAKDNDDISSAVNTGAGGSPKKNAPKNEDIALADEELNEYAKDSRKAASPEEKPAMPSASTRAEKSLTEGAKADKYEAYDGLAKTSEKSIDYKKEAKSKAKKSNAPEQAPASASGIAYAPQQEISATEDAVYSVSTSKPAPIETLAEYPGGQDSLIAFIRTNFNKQLLNTNETLAKQIVEVKLTIDKKGRVTNSTITKGLTTELDKELLRVLLLMQKWKPATINGEKVAKEITLPIQLVK